MTEDQKNLINKLRSEGYGYLKISQEIGVSVNTVKSYCRRNEISSMIKETITSCEQCGKPIDVSRRITKRFCSDTCRNKWWNTNSKPRTRYSAVCPACGVVINMHRRNEKKYCSHACYIKTRYKNGDNNE